MIEIQRILCPTDFSDFSRNALEYALALARWYESEISVVHVLPQFLMHPEYFPYLQQPVLPDSDLRESAQTELGRFVHTARDSGVTTEVRIEEGQTEDAILDLADQLPADLIVMGTHGRRGFERLVLGSVTEKVLRKAQCPVMTVSQIPRRVPDRPLFKYILCPVDFSTSSTRALEFALSLAEESDGELTLLHVVESLFEPLTGQEGLSVSDYRDYLEKDALRRLKAAVPDKAREFCQPQEVVIGGRPHRQILKLASEKPYDLIVMGVQGRGAMDLALFGSTTQQVVREAKCPVLTIRSG